MSMSSHVATRYLQARPLDTVARNLERVAKLAEETRNNLQLVDDLVAAGEKRRVGRVSDINVGVVSFDGRQVKAKVAGTTGDYDTRITVSPRGHHCTCQDWEKNGRRVGPCKHVLALGLAWKAENLVPTANNIEDHLFFILDTPF
jgi:uncharacterized Zn finger protein